MRPIACLMLTVALACIAACSTSGGSVAPVAGGSGSATVAAAVTPASLAKIDQGMGEQRVLALLGPPSAEGEYTPRLGRILGLVGVDAARRTYFYKGAGRVLFSGGKPLLQTGTVERVEQDPDESGKPR